MELRPCIPLSRPLSGQTRLVLRPIGQPRQRGVMANGPTTAAPAVRTPRLRQEVVTGPDLGQMAPALMARMKREARHQWDLATMDRMADHGQAETNPSSPVSSHPLHTVLGSSSTAMCTITLVKALAHGKHQETTQGRTTMVQERAGPDPAAMEVALVPHRLQLLSLAGVLLNQAAMEPVQARMVTMVLARLPRPPETVMLAVATRTVPRRSHLQQVSGAPHYNWMLAHKSIASWSSTSRSPLPPRHSHSGNCMPCAGNTASTRKQWCQNDIQTDYYEVHPCTGKTREYFFEVSSDHGRHQIDLLTLSSAHRDDALSRWLPSSRPGDQRPDPRSNHRGRLG